VAAQAHHGNQRGSAITASECARRCRRALELLEDERDSEARRAMAKRLQVRAQLICSAIHCTAVR
jgi:hypothetical protein